MGSERCRSPVLTLCRAGGWSQLLGSRAESLLSSEYRVPVKATVSVRARMTVLPTTHHPDGKWRRQSDRPGHRLVDLPHFAQSARSPRSAVASARLP